jgi:hypothetical protein
MENKNSFPRIDVSESEKKKEDYYLNWVKAIVSNTFTDNYVSRYNVLAELYKLFQSGTSGDMTDFLRTGDDGSSLPVLPISVNEIRNKVKLLLGELEERGYEIKAKAINSEAISRKLEEKERLRIERKLQPLAMEAEAMTGLPLQSGEYIPHNEQELDEYMDMSWKDKHVTILEAALKFIAQTTHWDDKRIWLFRDLIIANMSIVKNEIIRGIPQGRRINPLHFIFDPNSTDDNLSDSTYFGEVDYMPLAQVAEQYGLSEEEVKEAYSSYQEYLGMGQEARSAHGNHSYFSSMPDQCVKWFKVLDGTPRCLVIRACWRDYKTLNHKYENLEKGEFLQDVSDEPIRKRDKEKIITNKIETWRQGTLIGGKILKEWGECPNQARDLSKLEKSEPPYKVWIPDFIMGKSVGMVEQISGLQLLKDITITNMQLAMARAGSKGFVYDMAMKPDNMTHEQVMSYLKSSGIMYVNSKEYQMSAGNVNLFKEFDMSLSDSVAQYISIMNYIDSKMDSVTGISPERQGVVQGSSQAVGVTQAALFQSNLITAPYFKGFERFCSRIMNHQAKLVKVAWAGKEKFAPIIGDVGIDFLKDNIDISLDEFDVIIQSLPPLILDRQKLEGLVNLAVQSQQVSLEDALAILMEPDTKSAVRRFQRKMALRKMYDSAQEQQMQEQEAAAQEQQMAMQQQMSQEQLQTQLMLQNNKAKNNLDKTRLTGRVKLAAEKMRNVFR